MLGLRRRGHGHGHEEPPPEEPPEEPPVEGGSTPGTHPNGLLAAGHTIAVNGEKLGGGYQSGAFFDYPQSVVTLTNIVQVAVGSGTPIMLDDNGRPYATANGETGNAGIGDAAIELYDPVRITGGVPLYPQQDIPTQGVTWRQPTGPVGPTLPTKEDYEHGRSSYYIVAVDSSASHSAALTNDGRPLTWGSNNGAGLGNGYASTAAGDSKRAHDERLRTTLSTALVVGKPITLLKVVATEKGQSFAPGQQVILETIDNLHRQVFTLSQVVEGAATSLPIEEATPNFAFPVGALVLLPVYPQMAPLWAQTKGPPQSETGKNPRGMSLVSGVEGTPSAVYAYDQIFDSTHPSGWGCGRAENIVTGVDALRCCKELTLYLKGDHVHYSGTPAGKNKVEPGATQIYVAKDPVWDPTNPEHLPPGYHVIAIDGTRGAYMLLISNGNVAQNKVRWIGNNERYAAGNGQKASATSTTREVLKPTFANGSEPEGIVALAKAEYSFKLVKLGGSLWTAGDNFLLQQGLGKLPSEPEPYVVEIPLLKKVIAVSSTGEPVLGPGGFTVGVNGGDMTAILYDDHTTACFGLGFVPSTGAGEHWEGVGSFGMGHSDHVHVPTPPLGNPKNIRQVCVGPVNTYWLQEPGAPAAVPSLVVTSPAPGQALVKITPPPGAVGQLPNLRDSEGYEVKMTKGPGPAQSVKLPPSTRTDRVVEHLFTGLAAGEWTAIVNEQQTAVEPVITSGATNIGGVYVGTAVGGVLSLTFGNPPVGYDEDRFIVEWRHRGTYLNAKGVATEEDWIRNTPDVPGANRSVNVPITPSAHGIAGEEVEVRLYGYFSGRKGQTEGTIKKRTRAVIVP